MKREYFVIAAEFWADLGDRFVNLVLLDRLVFNGPDAARNLLWLILVQQGPSIFLSPGAGGLIDRTGAGKWMAAALAVKCVLAGALVFADPPGEILAIYCGFICASLFFTLGRLAIVPAVIPGNRLIAFNALNERIALSGSIAGPFLVGRTLAEIGRRAALGVSGFIFLMAIGAVCMFPDSGNSAIKGTARGLEPRGRLKPFAACRTVFRNNRRLKTYFFILGCVLICGGVLNFTLPILCKQRFDGDIVWWALTMSFYQAGAFLSTCLLPKCAQRFTRRRILAVAALILGAALGLSGSRAFLFCPYGLAALLGFGFTLMHVYLESLIQQGCPLPRTGRIASLMMVLRGTCHAAATIGASLALNPEEPGTLLLGGALFPLFVAVLIRKTAFRVQLSPP